MLQTFSWLRYLPAGDRIEFVRELTAAMDHDSPTPILHLMAEWRNTAQIYADPDLLRLLRSEIVDDAGPVPAPPREG
ncbi:hypothetical protein [Kribbella sp. NPDC051620]|uniref:hypothetical protein n=1 Tax=Kribbella sp. NPDC051620 TaxID=3364120 RepID=UPI0037AB1BA5